MQQSFLEETQNPDPFWALFCSLMVPFLRFGEIITGGHHFPLTSDAFKKVLTGQASHEALRSIFLAVYYLIDVFIHCAV